MFLHREINTYFRRLAWSPDGSFMVVPCGQYKEGGTKDGKVAAVNLSEAEGDPAGDNEPEGPVTALTRVDAMIDLC